MTACCIPRRKQLSRWALVTVSAALLLTGATVWAAQKLLPVGDNIECVVDGYKELKGYITSSNLTAAANTADAIDDKLIDYIEEGLNERSLRVYGPGMITAAFLLLAALATVLFIKATPPSPGCWRCTSKWLVLVSNLLLIIAFVFFAVCLLWGILPRLSSVKEGWDDGVGSVCGENRDSLNDQLDQTKADLAALPPSAPAAQARAAVSEAENQLATFNTICKCIEDTFSVIDPLLGPGILGVIGFLFAFVAVAGLCCTMSCCREPGNLSDLPGAAGAAESSKGKPWKQKSAKVADSGAPLNRSDTGMLYQ